jgi:hypothetical protein
MPRPWWKHTCSNGSLYWMGTPTCGTCQQSGEYDGWQPTMHEAMAQYQTLYRLKPMGPHRRLTKELFASAKAKCQSCNGHGLRDSADRRSWHVCKACRGLGSVFTRPADEIEALRDRVLAAHPDAAANPVRSIFAGPVVFAEATQEVIGVSHLGTVGSGASAPCEPVYQCIPSDGVGKEDVLTLIPPTDDILHLEGVVRLDADSSPLEQLLLWQPTDKSDQYLRRFLLDFGHRVLAAEQRRAHAR